MPRRRLLIAGAGDFGRELESHLGLVPESARDWELAGFLDDNPDALGDYPTDYKILGSISQCQFRSGDLAILAAAKPVTKRHIFDALRGKVDLFTFIAPDAIVSKFCRIGEGCIIGPRTLVGPNVTLGVGVFINTGTLIGHDVTIGDHSSFMANCNIAGHCKIGKEAYFASSITVIPGRSICDGAYIGAGSVVIQHIKRPGTVFGNPARSI